jgi:hypothetical protein
MIIFYRPDPDLHLHKDAILENNGTYTIEMDMFIQENPITTLVQQKNPLDIVLVLDQSSSLYQANINDDLQRAVNLFVDQIANHGRENKVDHRMAIVGFANEDTSGAVGGGPVAGSFHDNQTVQDKDGKWVRIQLKVDFIASLGSKKYYVQSALSIPDREKEIQESRSLTNINDSFKKVIIVKDHIMPRRNEDGILTIGLFDFLLKEDSLDI